MLLVPASEPLSEVCRRRYSISAKCGRTGRHCMADMHAHTTCTGLMITFSMNIGQLIISTISWCTKIVLYQRPFFTLSQLFNASNLRYCHYQFMQLLIEQTTAYVLIIHSSVINLTMFVFQNFTWLLWWEKCNELDMPVWTPAIHCPHNLNNISTNTCLLYTSDAADE